ncbi:hypothetical protein AB7M37_005884 [Sinorhizobium fredii]
MGDQDAPLDEAFAMRYGLRACGPLILSENRRKQEFVLAIQALAESLTPAADSAGMFFQVLRQSREGQPSALIHNGTRCDDAQWHRRINFGWGP